MVPDPVIQAVDRLADKIIGALHRLFGFQFSRNQEWYVNQLTINCADADAIGTVYTGAIRISQEADFVCTRTMAVCRRDDDGVVVGTSSATTGAAGDFPDVPFLLTITDGSTDRQLSNEAVDGLSVFGFGALPHVWPKPRLFARNSSIGIRATGLKASASSVGFDLRLAFEGFKIYDATSLDLTSRRA